jgi:hypothetical protein
MSDGATMSAPRRGMAHRRSGKKVQGLIVVDLVPDQDATVPMVVYSQAQTSVITTIAGEHRLISRTASCTGPADRTPRPLRILVGGDAKQQHCPDP